MGIDTEYRKQYAQSSPESGFYGKPDDLKLLKQHVGTSSVRLVDLNILAYNVGAYTLPEPPETRRKWTTTGSLEQILEWMVFALCEPIRSQRSTVVVGIADDQSRIFTLKRDEQKKRDAEKKLDADNEAYPEGTTLTSEGLQTPEDTRPQRNAISLKKVMGNRGLRISLWRLLAAQLKRRAPVLIPGHLERAMVILDMERDPHESVYLNCPAFAADGTCGQVEHARLFGEADLQLFTWVRRLRDWPIVIASTDSDNWPIGLLYLHDTTHNLVLDHRKPLWWWMARSETCNWKVRAADLRQVYRMQPKLQRQHLYTFLVGVLLTKTDFFDPDALVHGIGRTSVLWGVNHCNTECIELVEQALKLPRFETVHVWESPEELPEKEQIVFTRVLTRFHFILRRIYSHHGKIDADQKRRMTGKHRVDDEKRGSEVSPPIHQHPASWSLIRTLLGPLKNYRVPDGAEIVRCVWRMCRIIRYWTFSWSRLRTRGALVLRPWDHQRRQPLKLPSASPSLPTGSGSPSDRR